MAGYINIDGRRSLTGYAFKAAANAAGLSPEDFINNFDSPLFIAGMPRSRTSMVALSLLATGAYWVGTTRNKDHLNPTGYWENGSLYKMLTQSWLPKIKGLVTEMPAVSEKALDDGEKAWCRSLALNLMLAQGWNGGPWLLKNPSILLVADKFKELFPKSKLIICHRDDEDNLRSMEKFYNEEPIKVLRSSEVYEEAIDMVDDSVLIDTDLLLKMDRTTLGILSEFVSRATPAGGQGLRLDISRHDIGKGVCDAVMAKRAREEEGNPKYRRVGAW